MMILPIIHAQLHVEKPLYRMDNTTGRPINFVTLTGAPSHEAQGRKLTLQKHTMQDLSDQQSTFG